MNELSTPADLAADILDDLVASGVQLIPWVPVAANVDPDVMGIVFAPEPGIPAQATFRPSIDSQLALVVVRDAQRRLRREADGSKDVFLSKDPVNNRRVALIHGRPNDVTG